MDTVELRTPASRHRARPLDPRRLARDLRAAVRGEVRFDEGSRALYATDGSNYRHLPIGVVVPRDVADLVRAVEVCREHQAPILPRGGGTSLAGQGCNAAVILDTSQYLRRILALDPDRRLARVEPGVVLDDLRKRAAAHGLTFAPDPSTHNHCALGGMIGNNSCGIHSMMAGRTADNVESLEVLTYRGLRLRVGPASPEELRRTIEAGGAEGRLYAQLAALRDRYAPLIRERYPRIPRRVSGYNLDELLPENGFHVARALAGTEGTCAVVLEATLRLVPLPRAHSLLVLGYGDVYRAGDAVPEVLPFHPTGLEGIDETLVTDMHRKGLHPSGLAFLPPGKGWLLVEFGGDSKAESDARAREAMARLARSKARPSMKLFDQKREEAALWKVRELGLGATARVPGQRDAWEGWEDSAVPPDQVGAYLRELHGLFDRFGYRGALYGHLGQGCIHTRIDFGLKSAEGVRRFRSFVESAADLVSSHGGSLSGEHGDGQSRAELLPRMFGRELVGAFEAFKAIWDPDWLMNPGKVVRPRRLDEDLRLGPRYAARQPATHFAFADDRGSLAYATERCVGIGECRRLEGATMCPSYRATLDERHSTRGRAHLLFEMLRSDSRLDGWRDRSVREALDLCLSCKGCKSDCPMGVDMATYKAEFLSHHYQGRLRPRSAYSMGLVPFWAAAAARAPRLVNWLGQTEPWSSLAKWLGGLAPERSIPAFAPQTLQRWFRRRGPGRTTDLRVLLWPDTFNNHFHPEVGRAAVQVLEHAGCTVDVPRGWFCCGRPLYDFGMLPLAKHLLRRTMRQLDAELEAGTPLVFLEPSCLSVFRDELPGLFPEDPRAKRLAGQALLLGEFLDRRVPWFAPPPLPVKAVVHGHCHQKAILGMDADRRLLGKLGVDLDVLDSGCCGMAGAFGFERGERHALSMKIGELSLLPAVRAAPKEAVLVASGFSCRTQVEQATDRRPLHMAEVLKLALDGGGSARARPYPERALPAPSARPSPRGLVLAAALALGGYAWWRLRASRRARRP
ncbi:MAG TPA: FAD-binding and (Fe-S)-binding domain-containing protein [Myxococcales bacterium]|nr:FAD-binding and (Fe-S)-binding domain-containing protein [Myxococcales bacterium]